MGKKPACLLLLLGFVCCAPEKEAARLIYATITSPEWESETTIQLGGEINCGSGKIKIAGGTTKGTPVAAGQDPTRIQYDWAITLQLPMPTNSQNQDPNSYKLDCPFVTVESGFQQTAENKFRLLSPIKVTSCANFNCTLRKAKLNCGKLQAEMEKACQ